MHQPLAATPIQPLPLPERRGGSAGPAQIWQALRRRWRWVLAPTALACAAALSFVNSVSPRYIGEVKVLLENRESFYLRLGEDHADRPPIDDQAVASQVQVVMSRDLARDAVKQLGLVGNPEFDPLVHGIDPVRRLLMLARLADNPYDHSPEERALESFYERLSVYPAGKSRVLSIEFSSRDPELAARAANTVAGLYLDLQEAAKKDAVKSALTWLGPALDQLRSRVSEAEAKVEEFRARTGLLVGGNNATIVAQQLSDLNAQLSQARTVHADAQAKVRLVRDLIDSRLTVDISYVVNDELIRRLTEQSVSLRSQLARESRTLLPKHPRIMELNAQLSDLDSQMQMAAKRTVRTLENEVRIAASRVESLQAEVDAQKAAVARASESEVRLRALEREARAEREQLEAYLIRYREALARDVENSTPPDARIISRAVVPQTPSFPNKVPTVAFATLAMLILSIGAVVARELLGAPPVDAPASPMSVASRARNTQQSVIPLSSHRAEPRPREVVSEPSAKALPEPATSTAESTPTSILTRPSASNKPAPAPPKAPADRYNFDTLVARLSKAKAQGRGRRVLITSVERAVDATDMAKGIGRMLSQGGRAILVSLDASSEAPARGPGLTDLVGGKASFSDIIERESGLRLHTVPVGKLDAAVLHQDRSGVDLALSAFDQTYDWVLCVLCHSSNEALLSLFASRVDAVVIASNADPASGSLVDLYEKAKDAGAPDVVVAREQAPAAALAA